MAEEIQISLLPLVDWRGVAWASTLPLSYLQSRLLFFQRRQAYLGKAWSRSGNTAPIVTVPDGGPRAGWTPASQRSALVGLSLNRPGLCSQGRTGEEFPSWHRQMMPLVLQGKGGFCWILSWSVGLYQNLGACVATCGPSGIGGSAYLWHYYIFTRWSILWLYRKRLSDQLNMTKHCFEINLHFRVYQNDFRFDYGQLVLQITGSTNSVSQLQKVQRSPVSHLHLCLQKPCCKCQWLFVLSSHLPVWLSSL